MKFSVRPLDGGPGRLAVHLAFVDSDGETATALCPAAGGFLVWEKRTGESTSIDRTNDAADLIGRMLHRYRDRSLVVYSGSGYRARGDEDTTADVYPPGKHPRINVER